MVDIWNLIILLRREIHKYAEESLKEYNTQKLIINFIVNKLEINHDKIRICGDTGLILKLQGESNNLRKKSKNIMFRSELDALKIKEINNLPFKSVTNFSHMCGHDGHMAMLIYGIYLVNKNLNIIPKNCSVSFIFQPGEEGRLGSVKMIKDGCLKNIDEIYAIHNACFDNVGDIFIRPGPVWCGCKRITIKFIADDTNINNKNIKNPVLASCEFNLKIEQYYNSLTFEEKKLITFCFPLIKGSDSYDTIPKISYLKGYVRSLDISLLENFEKKMKKLIEDISKKYKVLFKIHMKVNSSNPCYNDEKLTNKVIPILKNKFKNVFDKYLPSLVSDDFSYYQKLIPGLYFLLANGYKENENIHGPHYIFNEDLIEIGGNIWLEIAQKRLSNNFN